MKKFSSLMLVALLMFCSYKLGESGSLEELYYENIGTVKSIFPIEFEVVEEEMTFYYGTSEEQIRSTLFNNVVTEYEKSFLEDVETEVGKHLAQITITRFINYEYAFFYYEILPSNDSVFFTFENYMIEDEKLYLQFNVENKTGRILAYLGDVSLICKDLSGNVVVDALFYQVSFSEEDILNESSAKTSLVIKKGYYDESYFTGESVYLSYSFKYYPIYTSH